MKPTNNKSANRAKKVNENQVNNANTRYMDQATEAIPAIEAVDVETVETQTNAAALPAVKETEKSGKVSSKDVLKAAGNLRASVKEERRGANCTIRLIAERAASGDAAAVDVLCALCDVPRAALFSINIDTVRAAVNSYYPYYMEVDNRRVSVKPVGVRYSKANGEESIENAAKRVQRGYIVSAVTDYLDQLIKAAKSRAKGVQPRRVDAEAVYDDITLSEAAVGVTAAEIDEAKKRKAYLANAVNVWKKDRNGFYI